MGEFMQYLPGLCLCCVITSRARLSPRPRLSGHVPKTGSRNPRLRKTRCSSAAAKRGDGHGSCSARPDPAAPGPRRRPHAISPLTASKNRPRHLPHPSACTSRPPLQHGRNVGAGHAPSRVSIGHHCPRGDDAPTFASGNISQRVGGPRGQRGRSTLRPGARLTGAPVAGFNEKLITGVWKVPRAPRSHMLRTRLGFREKHR